MTKVTALSSFTAYPRGARAHISEGDDFELSEKTAKAWAAKGLVRMEPETVFNPTSPNRVSRKLQKNTDADSE